MSKIDYSSTTLGSPENDARYENLLRSFRDGEPQVFPLITGVDVANGGTVIDRRDPVSGALVGRAVAATPEDVDQAVSSAARAQHDWRRRPFTERNEILSLVAEDFTERLYEVAALVSAETGKTRLEAVGEVEEVVDMIKHYTAEMERNNGFVHQQQSSEQEVNLDLLRPYGVFAVIAPFNFPVALAVGMTVGALVTGNTVVLKPSEKTPASTSLMAEIFAHRLPQGVLNLVNGDGEIGSHLAEHPLVDGIAFTGSAEVGWGLTQIIGRNGAPKPVLAEMGGQNPTVVTRNADIESAAEGIVRSAFGLSGQKCSACRRVVVEEPVADALIAAVRERASKLVVGDPLQAATDLGPLIDDAIALRVDEAITIARDAGAEVSGGRVEHLNGNYFAPIVISGLPLHHPLTREELFAPVLTVTRVESFAAAMAEANATDYGLSAGIFSRDQDEVDTFLDSVEAGVLYVNRASGATTGAWPGVQSFCGWKRSGTSGKGGLGIWYLPGFMREQNHTIATVN